MLFFVIYEYFVRTQSGQLVDVAVRATALHFEHPLPPLDPQNRWITFWIIAPPAVIFLAIVLIRQKFLAALIAVATAVGAILSTQALKHLWLDRPQLIQDGTTANALPSGHTTLAAAVAVGVFLVASPRQRPALGLLSGFWAAGWGAYIFIGEWHRPSDMVAAYLVVAVWALVGGWLIMRLAPHDNSVVVDHEPFAAGAASLSWLLGITLTGGGGLCLLFAGGWDAISAGLNSDYSRWHWVAGTLLSGGPAFLVAGAGINLFHAEAGRRQHGAPVPSPKGEKRVYPVPPEYRTLYDRV